MELGDSWLKAQAMSQNLARCIASESKTKHTPNTLPKGPKHTRVTRKGCFLGVAIRVILWAIFCNQFKDERGPTVLRLMI